MKILFLTLRDEHDAASQVRVYQFLPYFEAMSIDCAVEPFAPTRKNGESGLPRRLAKILFAFIKRLRIISSSGNYDAVVVQRDVLPFGLQGFLKWMNPNIIFEFDDAIWELTPQQKNKSPLMRWFFRYQIGLFNDFLGDAKIILTESPYLVNYAKKFNDKVAVITAPIDTGYFAPSDDPSTDKDAIVLGWVGTHGTTYMLESIAGALERIGRKFPYVKFLNIGGYPIELKNMRSEYIPWRNSTILNDLRRIDIGLMPLVIDSVLNEARFSRKMVIYMSMSIPFVAQDIGLNKIVVKNGVNGFLTRTEDEWIEKLSRLIEDRRLRQEMGANGRKIATEQYDIRDAARRYAELLYKTAEK